MRRSRVFGTALALCGLLAFATAAAGLSRRLLNLAERGGSGAQHTARATVVKIAETRS